MVVIFTLWRSRISLKQVRENSYDRAGGMGLFTVALDERLECDVAHGPCHPIFRCNPEVRGGSGGCD